VCVCVCVCVIFKKESLKLFVPTGFKPWYSWSLPPE
jgi:hypothetical protein